METIYTDFCSRCRKKNVPLIKNFKATLLSGVTKQYHMCRECTNNRTREYYSRNKERCRQIIYKSTKKHIEKQRARGRVREMLKYGRIIKPDNCQKCNQNTKLQAHHLDYENDIFIWVCSSCHADAH